MNSPFRQTQPKHKENDYLVCLLSATSEVNDKGTNCCVGIRLNFYSEPKKAKVEINQLWLYSYIRVFSNNFSRLLPFFFVPPPTAEKAIYSEDYYLN